MRSRLQTLYKNARDNNVMKKGKTYEDWQKAIKEFGIECYIKASQGKLIEVDYKKELRYINKER